MSDYTIDFCFFSRLLSLSMADQSKEASAKNVEEITVDVVRNGIAYGNFKAELDITSGALASDVIQKIYKRANLDGSDVWLLVRNFSRCSRCDAIIQTRTGNGTQPLIRHKEVSCKKFTTEQKAEYARLKTVRLNALNEQKALAKLKKTGSKPENEGATTSTESQSKSLITEPTGPIELRSNQQTTLHY